VRDGKTEMLEDFTSRFGRPFTAKLFLKDNGRHGFEFAPRAASKKATGKKGGKKATRKKAGKKTTRKKSAAKKSTRMAAKSEE
jgi:hypothetical protein